MGAVWNIVLLIPAGIWAGSRIVLWGLCFVIAICGALSLIASVLAFISQRRLFIWLAVYGACSVLALGVCSFASVIITEHHHETVGANVSFAFTAIYFMLAITAPLFCHHDVFL